MMKIITHGNGSPCFWFCAPYVPIPSQLSPHKFLAHEHEHEHFCQTQTKLKVRLKNELAATTINPAQRRIIPWNLGTWFPQNHWTTIKIFSRKQNKTILLQIQETNFKNTTHLNKCILWDSLRKLKSDQYWQTYKLTFPWHHFPLCLKQMNVFTNLNRRSYRSDIRRRRKTSNFK